MNEGLAGGVLRVAIEEAVNLNLIGQKAIIHSSFTPYMYRGFLHSNVRIYKKVRAPSLSPFVDGYTNSVLREILGILFVPRVPSHFKADWIICHNLSPIYDALRLRKFWNSKIAVIIHNPTFPPPAFNFMSSVRGLKSLMCRKSRILLEKCNLVIATSETTKELVRRLYGFGSAVLYPGCNPLHNISSVRGPFILCAQRLSIGKRIQEVAKVIALVNKDVKVVFAGSLHPTTGVALRKIKASGLRAYVVIPNITEDDLRKLYATCRFFISVIGEPFGMPQIEAASCGAPMVCSARAGASELFSNGIHGYFCGGGNGNVPKDQYANYVEELLDDERRAWRMGYSAWKLCYERYTWNHHVRTLLNLLENA